MSGKHKPDLRAKDYSAAGKLTDLTVRRDEPEFPHDALVKTCIDGGAPPRVAKKRVQDYENLKLTLPLSEEGVRRLCKVMSVHGLITTVSCHGHPG